MVNYSWKASPNRWGRPEFNATIGFGNGLNMLCGKAGFEPRTLGTKAGRYDHCASRPVIYDIIYDIISSRY